MYFGVKKAQKLYRQNYRLLKRDSVPYSWSVTLLYFTFLLYLLTYLLLACLLARSFRYVLNFLNSLLYLITCLLSYLTFLNYLLT